MVTFPAPLELKFHSATADVFVPDGLAFDAGLARVTHLGIGAHQDDLEFMAFHGIAACYDSGFEWFGGITCANGAGSARTGNYAAFTDAQIMALRREEQRRAATLGHYAAMVQLDYPSAAVKGAVGSDLREDLKTLIAAMNPRVIYTHNPADKHDTHVAVAMHVIHAIRELPPSKRPEAVHGCEVWRDLDWMPDKEKVVHDVSGHEKLAAELGGVFDSQIGGGKRYDLAMIGRRRANATFLESHSVDSSDAVSFAMDLTPLIRDDTLDIVGYVSGYIDRFKSDVIARLAGRTGK